MKKILLFSILSIAYIQFSVAQSDIDALRFSQTFEGGTARSLSMAGAFSSLGVDLSVLATNPAGIAFSRNSYFSITPQLGYTKTSSLFNDAAYSEDDYNFKINNIGFTSTYLNNSSEKGWKALSLGVAYNKLKNFNMSYVAQGNNTSSSMLDHFMYNSDGNISDNLYNNSALMRESYAWETFLLDLDTENNPNLYYWNPIWADGKYGQLQQKTMEAIGNVGEYSFALAANFEDILYLGATLGIQSIYYKENTIYSEDDVNGNITEFKSFEMREMLQTTGTGYNFKFGIIVRPITSLRISAAFHTPTFYSIHDNYSLGMESHFDYAITESAAMDFYSKDAADVLIGELVSDYKLSSAPKFIAGASFIISNFGLISMDYEYTDFSLMDMSASDYNYFNTNQFIAENYTVSHTIRLGTEIVAIPGIALRGGALYATMPQNFVDDDYNRTRLAYSGGIGLNSESAFLDLGLIYETFKWQQYSYTLPSDGAVPPLERVKYENFSFVATFGLRF